jgi:hypothetical protein
MITLQQDGWRNKAQSQPESRFEDACISQGLIVMTGSELKVHAKR